MRTGGDAERRFLQLSCEVLEIYRLLERTPFYSPSYSFCHRKTVLAAFVKQMSRSKPASADNEFSSFPSPIFSSTDA